jgi:hypothetical protein
MEQVIMKATLGLLLLYGNRLPPAGVVFLVPAVRGMLTHVREAARVCAERWPNKDNRKKYEGIWADGSLSKGDEAKDRAEALRVTAWKGNRYEWLLPNGPFMLLTKGKP